jgi:general secretion pathway protein A
MYEQYYGLRERPFALTPNPRFLYLTGRHREALAHLEYGITGAKGITVVTGEAGTGKTTLIRAALDSQRARDIRCVLVDNPTLTRGEFIELLGREFELSTNGCQSKAQFLLELRQLIVERHRTGGVTALVIDEAQSLPFELLEEVRLLANLETEEDKLLPVVLVGQPELGIRLNDVSLRQLKQRVALRCAITPLTLGETSAYVAGRIRIAGGDAATLFTRDAVELVFRYSGGIPRTISVICDNALINGFARSVRPVHRQLVDEVCRDFDLGGTAESARSAPAASPDEPAAFETAGREAGRSENRTAVEHGELSPADGTMRTVRARRRFSFFR